MSTSAGKPSNMANQSAKECAMENNSAAQNFFDRNGLDLFSFFKNSDAVIALAIVGVLFACFDNFQTV